MRVVKEHDERRTEILDTAENLFLTKGYEKTTINDILKTIGIAKGTFYYYFKSKEEVMDAVIMRIIDQDVATARSIMQDKQTGAIDKLLQYLFAQSSSDNGKKAEMLEQFPKVENALLKQRSLEQTMAHICPVLAEIIEAGNQTGEFHTDFPLEAIQFLIVGAQTLLDEGAVDSNPKILERRILALIDIIYKVLSIDESRNSKEATIEKLKMILGN